MNCLKGKFLPPEPMNLVRNGQNVHWIFCSKKGEISEWSHELQCKKMAKEKVLTQQNLTMRSSIHLKLTKIQ